MRRSNKLVEVGLDESGVFGKDLRIGCVSAEDVSDDLMRLYFSLAFANPYPPKGQTDGKATCEGRLRRYIEADPRLQWSIYSLNQDEQFRIAHKFAEFESRETTEVLDQAGRRMQALNDRLFRGLPADEGESGWLQYEVDRRPDQKWRPAVAGWWNVGERWVKRHQEYLRQPRRADRFTKALAYRAITEKEGWRDSKIDFFIDGGAPMVFWRQHLDTREGRYIHGVTNGDELHPLITASDRLCRAFPKMQDVPATSPRIRPLSISNHTDDFDKIRKTFKDVGFNTGFRNVILVSKGALPHGAVPAFVESVFKEKPQAKLYPERIRVRTGHADLFAEKPQLKDAVEMAVLADGESEEHIPRRCTVVTADEAWRRAEARMRELQGLAREASMGLNEQNKVVGRIQKTLSSWSKER